MATDYQKLFLSLEDKFNNNLSAYLNWWNETDNPALADYNTHRGIHFYDSAFKMTFYGVKVKELFLGIRGIVCVTSTDTRFITFNPLSVVAYKADEKVWNIDLYIQQINGTQVLNAGHFTFQSRYEQPSILSNRITKFFDNRNAFVKMMIAIAEQQAKQKLMLQIINILKIGLTVKKRRVEQEQATKLELERQAQATKLELIKQMIEVVNVEITKREKIVTAFRKTKELYNACQKQVAITDAVANYFDAFSGSPFSDSSDYSSYFSSIIDWFYFRYFRIMGLRVGVPSWIASPLSSSKRFWEMTDSFCSFLETDHAIPQWCSHTIAFALMRREAILRFRERINSELGILYDGSEARIFTTHCLRNGIIMPDDYDKVLPLAWCTTQDDVFDTSESDQFLENIKIIRETMEAFAKESKRLAFNDMLRKPRIASGNDLPNQKYTIDDIDLMTGVEFEGIIAKIFTKLGFHVTITKASGDQGIDVLAEKGVQRIGIQAKCYGSSVGNSAIQEAVAGKAFYNLTKVMVITNNVFTPSAVSLAQANNVVLWDRTILADKLALL